MTQPIHRQYTTNLLGKRVRTHHCNPSFSHAGEDIQLWQQARLEGFRELVKMLEARLVGAPDLPPNAISEEHLLLERVRDLSSEALEIWTVPPMAGFNTYSLCVKLDGGPVELFEGLEGLRKLVEILQQRHLSDVRDRQGLAPG